MEYNDMMRQQYASNFMSAGSRNFTPEAAGPENMNNNYVNNNVNNQAVFGDVPQAENITRNISETENEINNNMSNEMQFEPTQPNFDELFFYTVEKGDTIQSIAKKVFGDSEQYAKIMELNNLVRPVVIAGQTLKIPKNVDRGTIFYRVRPRDTLWKISQKFLGYGPRYEEIMRSNGLTSDVIYPGQVLKINVRHQMGTIQYVVRAGDTLWKIAQKFLGAGKRYPEIMVLNNLSNGNIKAGQKLNIPKK